MIRAFTKSAMSFSWVLSLLSLKQATNLLRPGSQRGGDLFAPITEAAVEQLDDSIKGIFRSGDSLQARAVDMAFVWMNPMNWMNPNSWMAPFRNCSQPGGGCGQTNGGAGQTANGFTQGVSGLGQAASQMASGFTQAIGQAATGLNQAASRFAGQPPNAAGTGGGDSAPVSNDTAAAAWGRMPGDR